MAVLFQKESLKITFCEFTESSHAHSHQISEFGEITGFGSFTWLFYFLFSVHEWNTLKTM